MKNIVLTGFMGTGKTAVGRELARILGWRLIDVDEEIVKSVQVSINHIFETRGEAAFRDMEAETIRKLSTVRQVIISAGGGAVLRQENLDSFRRNGVVVCLTARPETILKRTGTSDERPLLKVENPLSRITELLEKRRPFYEKADVTIDTEEKTPRQIAEEILGSVGWKK